VSQYKTVNNVTYLSNVALGTREKFYTKMCDNKVLKERYLILQ